MDHPLPFHLMTAFPAAVRMLERFNVISIKSCLFPAWLDSILHALVIAGSRKRVLITHFPSVFSHPHLLPGPADRLAPVAGVLLPQFPFPVIHKRPLKADIMDYYVSICLRHICPAAAVHNTDTAVIHFFIRYRRVSFVDQESFCFRFHIGPALDLIHIVFRGQFYTLQL